MNSYLWLVVVLVVTATAGGLYGKGRSDGREACEARYAEQAAQQQAQAMQEAQKYEVERQRLKVKTDTLTESLNALLASGDTGADCKLSERGLRYWNSTLADTAESAD